jgi:hypothetical protein
MNIIDAIKEVNGIFNNAIDREAKKDLDYSKIDNIEWDGIDESDYPDFCDAYISAADYDGRPMTEEELENLDKDWVYEKLISHLF